MRDAWRRRTGLLDAPVRSRAKLACGVFASWTEAVLCNKRSRDALRTGHGASALTPLDGHGLRQALKQAKAA